MRLKILTTALLLGIPTLAADDPVLRAMRDELARSMRKLQLENLQKPYFIAYRINDSDGCHATAGFGALVASTCGPTDSPSRSRTLSVEVRVGDYARDNTNFFAFNLSSSGVLRITAGGGATIPIDDNYDEIRRQLWIATDSAYKSAVDIYAKKKAALENRTRTDDAPDFSHEQPVTDSETTTRIELSREQSESLAKELSALFRGARGIDNSEVRVLSSNNLTRYINSEGTTFTRQTGSVSITATADTQAVDGMPISDFETVYARSFAELPPRAEVVRRIRELQSRMTKLREAALVERYTGPVLFESEAAAGLIAQGLAPAFLGSPRLVVDDARFERIFASDEGTFADKLGGRVLPEFLTLTDDATARDFHGQPLFGGYQVDEDGVKARPTILVDKGILKTLLRTRALIPGTTASTGSRRATGAMPSNLLVTSEKALTADQLKQELIRLVKTRGKDYGILVRKISDPGVLQSLQRSRTIIITNRGGGGSIELEPIIAAYKVFPDGHEELVRNLTVLGLTLSAFKDIVAVSDTPAVYSTPFRPRRVSPGSSGMFIASGPPPLISVATPALLFDELTLQRPTGEVPKLPFSGHPSFDH